MADTAEVWTHTPTGDTWAVRLIDEEVAGAYGPLGENVNDLNWPRIYGYSPRAGSWIRDHQHLFDRPASHASTG